MSITHNEAIDNIVMKSILAHRSISQDNIDQEYETERLRRLKTLLKCSKKYKRLSVKVANYQWDPDTASISDEQSSKPPRTPKVSFSDFIQVIPDTNQTKVPQSLIKLVQALFRLKSK